MFTGIIEEVATVAAIEELGGGRRITIRAWMAPELRPDESVCVNGACQTVVRVKGSAVAAGGSAGGAASRERGDWLAPGAPAGGAGAGGSAGESLAGGLAGGPAAGGSAGEPAAGGSAGGAGERAREDAPGQEGLFEVVAVEETLRKTTLGALEEGMPVNLERAMRPTGRLDGHIVQGHVDATGLVVAAEKEQTNWLYRVRFAEEFAPYVIPVGSITIDGISLTVARLHDNELTVAIIPHTYDHTNVRTWDAGSAVNLEFDLIGKYVVRYMALRQG